MVDVYETGVIVITVTPPTGPAQVLEPLGKPGVAGIDGLDGWTPVLANVVDGQRRVLRVIDLIGGEGGKPAGIIGKYVGPTGLVTDVADGQNTRGMTGLTGADGAQGEPGAVIIGEGADVLTGDGPPDDSDGADNQLYLDNLASVIYKKITGHWVLQTSLKGQKGDTGNTGADGDDGAPGAPGAAGAQGIQGVKGDDGDDGAAGAAGQDGATIHIVGANPTSGLGNVGDLALNTSSYVLFDKTAPTVWTSRGTLRGADGTNGADGADGADGTNGIDGVDGVDGSTIRFGTTVPSDALGLDGDYYLRTTNGQFYAKSSGTYTNIANLTGPQGSQGVQGNPGVDGDDGAPGADGTNGLSVRFGSGTPSNALGVDGEVYFKTSDDHYYTKSSGTWTDQGSLVGATGAAGTDGVDGADGFSFLSGSGVPSGGLGNDGDTYLRTSNGDVYGPKTAGAWGSVVGSLKGPTGATGSTGLTGPSGGFAWLFDTGQTTSGLSSPDMRINNSAVTSASHVYLHVNALNASALGTLFVAMLNNTNTVKGYLIFTRTDGANNEFAAFPVTAVDIATVTTVIDLTVQTANIASNMSSMSNNVSYSVTFALTGDKGATGATGSTGSAGSNGSNGADGARGSRWTSGSGAPGTIGGQLDNDFYLRTSNSDVYQLISGTWTVVVNIKGAAGADGAPGGGGSGSASTTFNAAYTFSSTTTDSDPGSGNFRFSAADDGVKMNATLFISTTDGGGTDRSGFFDAMIFDNLVSNVCVVYQTSGGIAQTTKRAAFRIVSRTTATGYRKLGIEFLYRNDSNPMWANSDGLTFRFFPADRVIDLPFVSVSGANDSNLYGVPNFTILRQTNFALTASRAYCYPLRITHPILVRNFKFMVTTAASASNSRVLLYKFTQRTVDGPNASGDLIYDSTLSTTDLNSTGVRTKTPGSALHLSPGYYWVVLAIGTFSGSPAIGALSGVWEGGGNLLVPFGTTWEVTTSQYFNANYSGTPPQPLTGLPTHTSAVLNAAGLDTAQYSCLLPMTWEPIF